MMRRWARLLLLTASFAVGTIAIGWLAVPLLAVAAGVLLRHVPRQAVITGFAASLAWGLILVWSGTQARIWPFAGTIGGALGSSAIVFVLVTLLFPGILAWALASLAQWAARGKPGTN
jgi:hypothetical protein